MTKNSGFLICFTLICLLTVACSKVPSYVIQPEKMARLMADMHTAEAVVDFNRQDYYTDSSRLALKQSVYARHGVTSQDFDTSLVWYGHHLPIYMDVYDRTIQILDERIALTGNRIAAEAGVSVAGDSVDVWTLPRFIRFNSMLPSRAIVFELKRDNNWESGDSYTLRSKLLNNIILTRWGITAEYTDGAIESVNADTQQDGWSEITFITDSARQAKRLYGYIEMSTDATRPAWIDSTSLIRRRFDPARYGQRYRQRMIKPGSEQ